MTVASQLYPVSAENLVNWDHIAQENAAACPSPAFRTATASILQKTERIGPLLGPQRTANDEFCRVYKFLTYNEPARVMAVVDELLRARERSGKSMVRFNAWNYVVGAFDLWLSRARIFYIAAGLIEGALRARLDARMTDHYGSAWPKLEGVVPSPVRPLVTGDAVGERLGAIRRLLDEWDSEDEAAGVEIIRTVQGILAAAPHPTQRGELLVGELEFGQLRSFFQAKRLWNKGPKLETLFRRAADGTPLLRDVLDESLSVVQALRNDVAHYLRPITAMGGDADAATSGPAGGITPDLTVPAKAKPSPSFTSGLYHLSRLANWMEVDLQHFYESVDTREATELSLLLEDPTVRRRAEPATYACCAPECTVKDPLTLILQKAPTATSDVDGPGEWACLYHRVERRVRRHRPKGE